MNYIDRIGERLIVFIENIKSFGRFMATVVRRFLSLYSEKKINADVLVRQVYFTGFEAFWLVSIIAFGIGALIILQGNIILSTFGQTKLMYVLLVTVVIRELSSILTALIVIARSGTSICTELGNMKVSHEIDLLQSYGISPINYLVISRVFGVVVALFTLTIYFNIISILGGWFFTSFFYPIPLKDFMMHLIGELSVGDLLISVIKSVFFGFFIALISCYQGLQVVVARTEVPQRTIRAVVQSILAVIVIDILITYIYYLVL
ncbi:MAG: ABC transporter permease [Candidatus Cloacimonadia bacterium]